MQKTFNRLTGRSILLTDSTPILQLGHTSWAANKVKSFKKRDSHTLTCMGRCQTASRYLALLSSVPLPEPASSLLPLTAASLGPDRSSHVSSLTTNMSPFTGGAFRGGVRGNASRWSGVTGPPRVERVETSRPGPGPRQTLGPARTDSPCCSGLSIAVFCIVGH